jgi:hypothetical protein
MPKPEKCTKWSKNIPNVDLKNPNGHNMYQYFSKQVPPKFTLMGIFGLKINHLATLFCNRLYPPSPSTSKSQL